MIQECAFRTSMTSDADIAWYPRLSWNSLRVGLKMFHLAFHINFFVSFFWLYYILCNELFLIKSKFFFSYFHQIEMRDVMRWRGVDSCETRGKVFKSRMNLMIMLMERSELTIAGNISNKQKEKEKGNWEKERERERERQSHKKWRILLSLSQSSCEECESVSCSDFNPPFPYFIH